MLKLVFVLCEMFFVVKISYSHVTLIYSFRLKLGQIQTIHFIQLKELIEQSQQGQNDI